MDLLNDLNFGLYQLLIAIFVLFAIQVFWLVICSPSKTEFWEKLVSRYKYAGGFDRNESFKQFLYYINLESSDTELATIQFNGARYTFLEEGLLIRPPVAVRGDAVLLPWSELSVGGDAKIPITGWKFCKFKKIFVNRLMVVLVVPEQIANKVEEKIKKEKPEQI